MSTDRADYTDRNGYDYPPLPEPDAHFGSRRDGDDSITPWHITEALGSYNRAPRVDLDAEARALDRLLCGETSAVLLDIAEAALVVISHRGGQIGEDAEDMLCAVEDRFSALRALIGEKK